MSIQSYSGLSSSELPPAILNYIAAANEGRIDDVVACFTQEAWVHDENRDHRGIDAIRDWIMETTEANQPKNEVLSAKTDGETWAVVSRISGNFPGSPVELDFEYVLNGGKISSLRIS